MVDGAGDVLAGGGVADDGGGVLDGLPVVLEGTLVPVPTAEPFGFDVLSLGVTVEPEVDDPEEAPLVPVSPTLLPGIVLLLPLGVPVVAPGWELV